MGKHLDDAEQIVCFTRDVCDVERLADTTRSPSRASIFETCDRDQEGKWQTGRSKNQSVTPVTAAPAAPAKPMGCRRVHGLAKLFAIANHI
jgi:hypothetical protein